MTILERKCPICKKPRKIEYSPFCSKACRDRDLLKWLDDGYSLPIDPHFSANPEEE